MISIHRLSIFFFIFILRVNSELMSKVCKFHDLDDILWTRTDGQFYVFREYYFWHYDFERRKLSEPRLIHDYWPDVYLPIEAASDYSEYGLNYTIFFAEERFWQYEWTAELKPNAKPDSNGTFEAAHLRQIEAIQLLPKNNAVVCNEDFVHNCEFEFDGNTFVFKKCVAYIIYNTFIKGDHCKALAKYDSKRNYMVAGERVLVKGNTTQVLQKARIKYDLFMCKSYFDTHRIQFTVVIVAIIVLFVTNAIIIGCAIYIKRKHKYKSVDTSDALGKRHTTTTTTTTATPTTKATHPEETE